MNSPTEPQAAKAEVAPALKPVIERHGQELVDFVLRLGPANMALDWLMTYSHTHSKLKPQVGVLINCQADLVNMLIAAKGWEWDKVMEVMLDVDRAAKLSAASAGPSGGN